MIIETRTILLQDAKDIQQLSKQLGYEMSLNDTIAQMQEIMNSDKDHAVVALVDNRVVGWIHGFKAIRLETQPFVEIGGLVVDEKYRGKKIGKKLIEKIKEWSLEKDVPDIRVRSNVKRTVAHQFYRSAGFNEMKEQKVFQMSL